MAKINLDVMWAMGQAAIVETDDYSHSKYLIETAIERKRNEKSHYATQLNHLRDELSAGCSDINAAGLRAAIRYCKNKMKQLDKEISRHQRNLANLHKPTKGEKMDERIEELEKMLAILKRERPNVKD